MPGSTIIFLVLGIAFVIVRAVVEAQQKKKQQQGPTNQTRTNQLREQLKQQQHLQQQRQQQGQIGSARSGRHSPSSPANQSRLDALASRRQAQLEELRNRREQQLQQLRQGKRPQPQRDSNSGRSGRGYQPDTTSARTGQAPTRQQRQGVPASRRQSPPTVPQARSQLQQQQQQRTNRPATSLRETLDARTRDDSHLGRLPHDGHDEKKSKRTNKKRRQSSVPEGDLERASKLRVRGSGRGGSGIRDSLGLNDRESIRRAFVLKELLDAPVALRRESVDQRVAG